MNNKIKIGIFGVIAIVGLFVLPYAMAAQENDYRAYVWGQRITPYFESNENEATFAAFVTYQPIFPSVTRTITVQEVVVLVDLSQPANVNTQVATAVKNQGVVYGYNVVKVFLPSYEVKVP